MIGGIHDQVVQWKLPVIKVLFSGIYVSSHIEDEYIFIITYGKLLKEYKLNNTPKRENKLYFQFKFPLIVS